MINYGKIFWIFILFALCNTELFALKISGPWPHIAVNNEDFKSIGNVIGIENPWHAFGSGIGIVCGTLYLTKNYWLTPIIYYVKEMDQYLKEMHQLFVHEKQKINQERGGSEFPKSKGKIYKAGEINTKLSDVAGMHGAKLDVHDLIEFLKNPERYNKMGAKIPKGVLLQGPPGTGKTLLARAIAGEVGCPFITVCASEFIELFVGAGAMRVRDLFARAKELAPCIIFFDEFDAIGKKRISAPSGHGDEQAQTLAQLLALMDGFEGQKNPIIVIGATNLAEVLDPAVLRPGRFDRIVQVDLPYLQDRMDILKIHAEHIAMSDTIDYHLIARATTGFSGAQLAHLLNEAAILAVNEHAPSVTMEHIDCAYDNITLGRITQGMEVIEQDLKETAIHEAGHSIGIVFTPDADPLYKVTIAPRSNALGITHSIPLRERYGMNESTMRAKIIVYLCGGLAEQEFGLGKKVGLSNDLKMAYRIAYQMVVLYGMSEQLRYISYAEIDHLLPNDIATIVHQQVQKIIDECYQVAQSLVADHKEQITQLADLLLKEKTIFGNVVYRLCHQPEPSITYGLAL